jgi:hypothetical protein
VGLDQPEVLLRSRARSAAVLRVRAPCRVVTNPGALLRVLHALPRRMHLGTREGALGLCCVLARHVPG